MKKLLLTLMACFAVITANAWTVYFNNADNWEEVCVWAWQGSNDGSVIMGTGWPGKEMTYNEGVWSYSQDDTNGVPTSIIFNNNNKKSQTETLSFQNNAIYSTKGIITTPNQLYIIGQIEGTGYAFNPTKGVNMQKISDGVFQVSDIKTSEGTAYLSFTSTLSSSDNDWGPMNGGRIGPVIGDTPFDLNGYNAFTNTDTSWQLEGGTYTFTVDFKKGVVTATGKTNDINPSVLYLIGQYQGGGWEEGVGKEMTISQNGIFKVENVEMTETESTFAFASDLTSWNTINASRVAPTEKDELIVLDKATPFLYGVDASWKIAKGTYNFTVNFNDKTVTVTGKAADPEPMVVPNQLYLFGNTISTNGNWATSGNILMTKNDNVFTVENVQLVGDNGGDTSYFSFTAVSSSADDAWDKVNAERYIPKPGSAREITLENPTGFVQGNSQPDSWSIAPGTYNFEVDFENATVTVTQGQGQEVNPTYPAQLYLVGDPQGWDIDESNIVLTPVTNEEGVYSGTFNVAKGAFSFRFYSELGNWDANSFGSQVDDNPVDIELNNGNYSGEVIKGKGSWQVPNWNGGTVTATVNLADMTVFFVCEEDEPLYPEQIYLVGTFNNWTLNDEDYKMTAIKDQEGVFEGSFEIPEEEENLEFKFWISGESWDDKNVNYGGPEFFLYANSSVKGKASLNGSNFKVENWIGGTLNITFNCANGTYVIDAPDQPETPSVDNIKALYLVGNLNDWNMSDDTYAIPLTDADAKIFSATFDIPETVTVNNEGQEESAVPSFKIRSNADWNYAFGYTDESGTTVQIYKNVPGLANIKMGTGTGNISLANWAGGPLTVTVDLVNYQVTLSSTTQPVLMPDELWLVGPFNGWDLTNQDYMLEQTGDNTGIYKATIELDETVVYGENEDGTPKNVNAADFKVAYGVAEDWSEVFGQTGGSFPLYSTSDVTTALAPNADGIGSWTISNWAGGKLTVTVDLNKGNITISGSDQPEQVAPGEVLYLVGAPQGWDIDSDELALELNEDGLYTTNLEIADDEFNFILYTALGDWESNYLGAPSTAGGNFQVNVTDKGYTGPISFESKTNWLISDWTAATVTITVDVENMTISFSDITPVEVPEVPEGNGGTFEGETETAEFDNGSTIDFDWSATWNKEATITFTLTLDSDMQGVVPQMYIDGDYAGDFKQVTSTKAVTTWSYTTTDKYSQDDDTDFAVGFKTPNSQSNQVVLPYTIGSVSSSTGNGSGSGSGSGDGDGDDDGNNGGTTSVDSLENDNAEVVIYNLQGVRVDRNKLTRGIYIINGKKVLVK